MKRYFTLPAEPIALIDPATDEQGKDGKGEPATVTHKDVFRLVIQDARFRAEMDMGAIYDLKKKLTQDYSSEVELEEEEHSVLLPILRRPAVAAQGVVALSDAALLSPGVVELFRSILNAQVK